MTAGGLILQVMTCFEQQHLDTDSRCDADQTKTTAWWIESRGNRRMEERGSHVQSHTLKLIHTHTVTEIPTIHMYLL